MRKPDEKVTGKYVWEKRLKAEFEIPKLDIAYVTHYLDLNIRVYNDVLLEERSFKLILLLDYSEKTFGTWLYVT